MDQKTLEMFRPLGEWQELMLSLNAEMDFSPEEQRTIKLFKIAMQKGRVDSGADFDTKSAQDTK
jgi:hypothetical protein